MAAKIVVMFWSMARMPCMARTSASLARILVTLPEMHVNEIHLLHNRHHKVSSLIKFHQNTKLYQI